MIYLDNAATTKLSDKALESMLPYLTTEYGNASSTYAFGKKAKEAIENARKIIAECLGCIPSEIYFTSGGSESDNQAILTMARWGRENNKKHIITTKFEHHAILNTLGELKDFDVEYLDIPKSGIITVEQVEKAIRKDTCLVSVMYANNEIGTIQPIKEIGKLCKRKGIVFHTDAVQAVGHLPINVYEQNIDMLSLSSHKFHGPKGIGVLYSKVPLCSLINGGGQERRKRAGTENVAAIVGMAKALEIACKDYHIETITDLRNRLINGIGNVVNGDIEKRLPGNANISFDIDAESLLLMLDKKGICVSAGSACSSGSSHVLNAIGANKNSLRFSLSEYTTKQEIDETVNAVKEIVNYFRNKNVIKRIPQL